MKHSAFIHFVFGLLLASPGTAFAQEKQQDVEELRKKVESLEKTVDELKKQQGPSDLDKALEEAGAKKESAGLASTRVGGVTLRLCDVSLDVLFAAGGSDRRDIDTFDLQGGGHDPNKRGFSMTQAEVSLSGAVDPVFLAESHFVFFTDPQGDTGVEAEEAFFKTSSLPWGLQVKGGLFLTEFGRINPVHPHAWRWIDQPIINTRVFSGDGLRAPGVRVSWIAPLPFMSEIYFGIQNARGETVASFLGPADPTTVVGHFGNVLPSPDVRNPEDMLYFLRWENGLDITDTFSTQFGVSALFGPNATGSNGSTTVFGVDGVLKWRPVDSQRGWPSVMWETEFISRNFKVDEDTQLSMLGTPVPTGSLKDWGFYTQALWFFTPPWAAGLRYEYATGSGDEFDDPSTLNVITHNQDAFRDTRTRISPLLIYHVSEFSRLRLQYNHDDAEHLVGKGQAANSVWLSIEFLIGAHPPHKY